MTHASVAPLPDSIVVGAIALRESRRRFRDRRTLEAHQDRLAGRHLPWVLANSPHTASRFAAAGLTADHWRELPPEGKAEMMAHFDRLVTVPVTLTDVLALGREAERSRDFSAALPTPQGHVTVGLSTGTSGNRGAFVVTRDDRLRWAGVILPTLLRPFPRALLSRARVAFFLRAEGGLYRSVESRLLEFSFFDLLRPVEELAAQLTAFAPTLLVGPPSVLLAVADAGGRAAPQRVVSVAEVLEEADSRRLETAFGAPVVQVYQATEGLLGMPCEQGTLHLNEAHVHIDLEPVGRSGVVRPVITDLRRRAQPVVRHRLDDLLVLGTCACDSPTHAVARIVGRQDDALVLPAAAGGTATVWPDFIRAAMATVDDVTDYRVTQTGRTRLEVATRPAGPASQQQLRSAIGEALRRSGVATESVVVTPAPWPQEPPGTKQRRVRRLDRVECDTGEMDQGIPC